MSAGEVPPSAAAQPLAAQDSMSAGEAARPASAQSLRRATSSQTLPVTPRRFSSRFFRSEIWLIFGRRRNWAGLAVLASVPILVNIAVKLTNHRGSQGPTFFDNITSNGLFAALASLTLE